MAFDFHTPRPFRNVEAQSSLSVRSICLGTLVSCIALAALFLPLEWNVLGRLQAMPQWAPLEHLLAQAPLASWLMMFVWGTAVPVSLLVMLSRHRNITGVLLAVAFAAIAVLWYIHMPAQSGCLRTYGSTLLCQSIAWGFTASLLLANAVYLFSIFLCFMTGLSLATSPKQGNSEQHSHA